MNNPSHPLETNHEADLKTYLSEDGIMRLKQMLKTNEFSLTELQQLFKKTNTAISPLKRLGKTIFQISFIITDAKDNIFTYKRKKADVANRNTPDGHSNTIGSSILISCSPRYDDSLYTPKDFIAILNRKLDINTRESDIPQLTMVGLVHNSITKTIETPSAKVTGETYYVFLVFELKFHKTSLQALKFTPIKDEFDTIEFTQRENSMNDILKHCVNSNCLRSSGICSKNADKASLNMLCQYKGLNIKFDTSASYYSCFDPRRPLNVYNYNYFFISYSTKDSKFVNELCCVLDEMKVSYWIEVRDGNNSEWEYNEQMIEWGRGAIFVETDNFYSSENTIREAQRATNRYKRCSKNYEIFRLVYKKCEPHAFAKASESYRELRFHSLNENESQRKIDIKAIFKEYDQNN